MQMPHSENPVIHQSLIESLTAKENVKNPFCFDSGRIEGDRGRSEKSRRPVGPQSGRNIH